MSILRRKRTLIDFEVQSSLLRRMAFQWLSFLLVNAIALFAWTYLLAGAENPLESHVTEFIQLYAPVLLISLALLPVYLLDAAKLSNRFAGPILRVRKALADAAAGSKVEPIKFRENDFWKSLAEDLNTVLKLDSKPATGTNTPRDAETVS